MGDLSFHPGDLVSMTDTNGQQKLGLYMRRCIENKKKKSPSTPSAADGGSNSQSGAEADPPSIDTFDLAYEDAYGPISTGGASVSPFVMVKWNPCGAEASHFSYWNSVGGMPPGVMGGSGDDVSSKVPMSSITLIDRNFNPGDRVSKYRRGKPPIQGHVIETNVQCDLRVLSPLAVSKPVVIEKVPSTNLDPMAPFMSKNKVMSYYNKKSKTLHLGTIEKGKYDIEIEFPDGALALAPSNIPALVLDLQNMQFSSLKSHTGNMLHIGQPLLISIPNLAQIKKWIKSGPNFGPQPAEGQSGHSNNSNVEEKVVATIVRFVPTKIIPVWVYPSNHVCGKDYLPYSLSVSNMKHLEETCWTWTRNFHSGRRTIFRKKFLYKLKEEDSTFINSHLSTSDSIHSSLCPNGNNNNNQGLLFYPCSCMSSLGLPLQSVSHATFLPMTDESKEAPSLKEVKVGDSVPVEVLRTHSLATVLWQDGEIETDMPCCNLLPGKYGVVMRDFFPGNLVMEKHADNTTKKMNLAFPAMQDYVLSMAQAAGLNPGSMGVSAGGGADVLSAGPLQDLINAKLASQGAGGLPRSTASDLNNYGIVLQTDPKSRTAHVKWVQVKAAKPAGARHHHKGGKKEVTERDPEEMSIYDLTHHPSVSAKFSIGHIVSRAKESRPSLKKDSKCKKHKKDKKEIGDKVKDDKVKKHKSSKKIKDSKDKENVPLGTENPAPLVNGDVSAEEAECLDEGTESVSASAELLNGDATEVNDVEMLLGAVGGTDSGNDDAGGGSDCMNASELSIGATGGEESGVTACAKGGKNLGMVKSFDPKEGRFVIHWLDGTTSKSLPHEVFSSMKDYDYQYDEEDDYWEGEDETVHYDDYYGEDMYEMDEKFDYDPDEAWLDDMEQGMDSSAPSESLEIPSESQDADIEVDLSSNLDMSNLGASTSASALPAELKDLILKLTPDLVSETTPSPLKEKAPPLPPKVGAEPSPTASPSVANGASDESTPTPSPNQPKSELLTGSQSAANVPVAQVLAMTTDAIQTAGTVAVDAATAATAATTVNNSAIAQYSLGQVLTTVSKLKSVMTDVVSVIGDLERVLQATTTTTANLSFATGFPALCANCATPASSVTGVVNPGAATAAAVTAAAVMKSMREADGKAAVSAGSVTCPSGHPLVPNAFGNSWVCDGADDPSLGACFDGMRPPSRTYSSNVQRNRCATCDYDLCAKCHAMKAEQLKNPQPLMALLPKGGDDGLLSVEKYAMLDHIDESHRFYRNLNGAAASNTSSASAKAVATIQKELFKIHTSLPDGIYVRSFEDHLDMCSFAIEGPTGTPYEDGLFLFDAVFKENYPKGPPSVHYISYCKGKLNPNLYDDGMVCLSLLGTWDGKKEETWNEKTSTFLQVLVSIQALVLNAEPYFNEPGFERDRGNEIGNEKCQQYNEVVLMKLLEHMSKLLQRPAKLWHKLIVNHFRKHGWRLYHRIENMMALSSKLTEAAKNEAGATSDAAKETSASVKDESNHLINFPLLPLTRGGCISLRRGLESYKKALLEAGFNEELSVFRAEDIALPDVDHSRI